ncbi:MFS general substrate transporter [Rhizoclosmatium globosum]|uniref:MFS general substrate transporter n=1 Tax=Rhizoclosmatium globosum TaxID=329046 RepID=A0A1Y2BTX7_9FUNG|nr:MFS general substrate transporter [Rhizoclosmatium globosum]|eukprot:ORY38201.1 MFS general substrate transporter [Rhizoclosmatium globosum]
MEENLSSETFKLYPQRFIVALAVFCGNFNNALMWSTYAAVTPSTAQHYGVSEWKINQLMLCFDICFFPFCGLALWVLDMKGVKPAVLVGVWFTVAGALLRFLSQYFGDPLTWVFAGTVFGALVNPFTLDSPTKAAAVWFGETERLTANTVMSLSTFLGSALVLFLAPAIVKGNPDNINTLNWATFVIIIVLALPSLFMQNTPPIPPSKVALEESIPFWKGVRLLATNSQFLLLLGIVGISMGMFEIFIALISDSVVPYGYSESDAGSLGVISIFSGIISSLLIARVLDYTKSHRSTLKILPFITVLGACGYFYGALDLDRRVLLYVSSGIIGMGCFPILPIALELGAECAKPVAEGTSGGIMETSIQICAIVTLLVSNALRQEGGKMGNALIWFISLCSLVAFLSLFIRRKANPPPDIDDNLEEWRQAS